MAEADAELRAAESERDNLQRTISEVQTALVYATAGSRSVLEKVLHNAASRLGATEKKIKEAKAQIETSAREQALAISSAAAKETALSANEKEEYSGFLQKAYFTKADFGNLETFYAKTWERLSEDGKAEMSKRVWNGIRNGKYKFSELPEIVQEKESGRVYEVIKKRTVGIGAGEIPTRDREDLIRAYESGDRKRTAEVLDRESFAKFFSADTSRSRTSLEVSRGKEAARGEIEKSVSIASMSEVDSAVSKAGGNGNLDLSRLKSAGAKLQEPPAVVSSTSIPTADGSKHKDSPSLGSG